MLGTGLSTTWFRMRSETRKGVVTLNMSSVRLIDVSVAFGWALNVSVSGINSKPDLVAGSTSMQVFEVACEVLGCPRPPVFAALVCRGHDRDPPACSHIQGDVTAERQPFVVMCSLGRGHHSERCVHSVNGGSALPLFAGPPKMLLFSLSPRTKAGAVARGQ